MARGKESACNAGDAGSIPGSGRFPGEGNDNPLQYSYLEIPWTEEPGELQSMGLQRVRHGLVTKHQHIHTLVCNLESILKSRDITLPKKVCLVKAMVFLVVMCGCELDYKES